MANKKTLELNELTIPISSAGIPIQDPESGATYHIKVSNLIGEQATDSIAYQEDLSYNDGDVVSFLNQLWISQQDDNYGVIPGTDEDYWVADNKAVSTGIPLYAAGIYTNVNAAVFVLIGNELRLARLVSAVRPYVSVNFTTELAAGDWQLLSGAKLIAEVSTAGSNITVDFLLASELILRGSASFSTPKNIVLTNSAKGKSFELFFNITNIAAVLTFVGDFVSEDGSWNSSAKTWTPYATGKYKIKAVFDGVEWNIERVQGAFT